LKSLFPYSSIRCLYTQPQFFTLFYTATESDITSKKWQCVEVDHQKNIGKTIEQTQKKGWRLHTYACAQAGVGKVVNHYLLFEEASET